MLLFIWGACRSETFRLVPPPSVQRFWTRECSKRLVRIYHWSGSFLIPLCPFALLILDVLSATSFFSLRFHQNVLFYSFPSAHTSFSFYFSPLMPPFLLFFLFQTILPGSPVGIGSSRFQAWSSNISLYKLVSYCHRAVFCPLDPLRID